MDSRFKEKVHKIKGDNLGEGTIGRGKVKREGDGEND
jgi:hypothetical protein